MVAPSPRAPPPVSARATTGPTPNRKPPQPAPAAPRPPSASRRRRTGARRSRPERDAFKVKVPDVQLSQKTLTEMSPLPLALDHVALGKNRGRRPSTGAENPALSEWPTNWPKVGPYLSLIHI